MHPSAGDGFQLRTPTNEDIVQLAVGHLVEETVTEGVEADGHPCLRELTDSRGVERVIRRLDPAETLLEVGSPFAGSGELVGARCLDLKKATGCRKPLFCDQMVEPLEPVRPCVMESPSTQEERPGHTQLDEERHRHLHVAGVVVVKRDREPHSAVSGGRHDEVFEGGDLAEVREHIEVMTEDGRGQGGHNTAPGWLIVGQQAVIDEDETVAPSGSRPNRQPSHRIQLERRVADASDPASHGCSSHSSAA
jgi:hypothetical protein